MPDFAYKKVLQRALSLTVSQKWLWFLGVLLSSSSILNFLNPGQAETQRRAAELLTRPSGLLLAAGFFIVLVTLQVLAKAALLWAAGQLTLTQPPLLRRASRRRVGFRAALVSGKAYFWRVLAIQAVTLLSSAVLFLLLLGPAFYFFSLGAEFQAVIMLVLGLLIFVPVIFVLTFLYLFGPIFAVVFEQTVWPALGLALGLVRKKIAECLGLAIILWAIGLGLLLLMSFSMLLVSFSASAFSPAGFAAVLLLNLLVILIFQSAFAVYYHLTWVLAVRDWVSTLRDAEPAVAVETA